MLGKRKIRKFVFELLFGYEFNKELSPINYYNTAFDNFVCEDDENESVKKLFLGICENISQIDEALSKHLNGWKASRLSKATITIIRISAYEMIYADLVPAISINEAVEFSKEYGEDGASSFVNGVLNSLAKELKNND